MLTGTLFGLASALMWSGANLTIHGASRRFGAMGAMFWCQVIGSVVAVIVALCVDGLPSSWSAGDVGLLFLASATALLAYGGLFVAMALGPISITGPIVSAWSVVSVAVGVGFLGQGISSLALFGVALVLLGNVILARHSSSATGEAQPLVGRRALGAAVISALGFGVMIPTIGVLGDRVGTLWAIPAVWGLELAMASPILLVTGRLGSVPHPREWTILIWPALLEIGGFISVTVGIRIAPLAIVAPCSSLSTAFTVLLGLVILRERLPQYGILGAAAACAGLVLVNL